MFWSDKAVVTFIFLFLLRWQADKEVELEKEIARGKKQDRKVLIEESFLHANSNKPVRFCSLPTPLKLLFDHPCCELCTCVRFTT